MEGKLIPGIKVSVDSTNRDIHRQFDKAKARWVLGGGYDVGFSWYALAEALRGVEQAPNNMMLKAYIMVAFRIICGDIRFFYAPYTEVCDFLKLSKAEFKKSWKNFKLILKEESTCHFNQNKWLTPDGWETVER